jgi:hypothetical protein
MKKYRAQENFHTQPVALPEGKSYTYAPPTSPLGKEWPVPTAQEAGGLQNHSLHTCKEKK